MPDIEFSTIEISAVISITARVLVIVVATAILRAVFQRAISKVITTRIPKIREESPDQLAVRSKTLTNTSNGLVSFVLWLVAGLMIFSELGVNIAPVLATVGLAGLAVGFAAQNIIRDYLHGFFIMMEDWYRIDEVAIVAGIGGLVVDVNLRRTVLRDLDGAMHIIPNSKIELASNLTRDWGRVNLNISVAYGENLDRVFAVINQVGEELKADPVFGPDLLTTPKAGWVDKLGDSGIEIKVLADTKPIRQWALTGELRKRLKDRFDQEGIEIPWPHTKVYFGNSIRGEDMLVGREAT